MLPTPDAIAEQALIDTSRMQREAGALPTASSPADPRDLRVRLEALRVQGGPHAFATVALDAFGVPSRGLVRATFYPEGTASSAMIRVEAETFDDAIAALEAAWAKHGAEHGAAEWLAA